MQAMSFLYEQGFPPLGHVHTGNLFLETGRGGVEVCRVGGYENTLLGFRTSHGMFANQRYSDAIDLRMFGECGMSHSWCEMQDELSRSKNK